MGAGSITVVDFAIFVARGVIFLSSVELGCSC